MGMRVERRDGEEVWEERWGGGLGGEMGRRVGRRDGEEGLEWEERWEGRRIVQGVNSYRGYDGCAYVLSL